MDDIAARIKKDVSLAPYTTLKVGGNAEEFLIAESREDIIAARKYANRRNINFTIIGWGSNSLVSDSGVKGLVVVNRARSISISGTIASREDMSDSANIEKESPEPRLDQTLTNSQEYYTFADIDYDESQLEKIEVLFESGVPWQLAINYTISKGATGLQFFSGIPGTVGGAVFNNMHGGTHFVSEFVTSVEVINPAEEIYWLSKEELDFDYDYSRFHDTKEVILQVKFNLYKGDKAKALATSIEWAKRKKLQPARSAGCTWRNITPEQKEALGFEATGQGYINDQKLGLKGYQVGGAKISNAHAAFIETQEGATAADVYAIIKKVESECENKFGYKPTLEIFLLGEF